MLAALFSRASAHRQAQGSVQPSPAMPRPIVICLLAGLVLWLPSARARTYTIDPAGAGDFLDLASAITACASGDTLLLVPGTHLLPDEGANLQGKAITLTSLEGPEVTNLSASFGPYGLILDSGEGPDTVIENLTLQYAIVSALVLDGSAPTIRNVHFDSNSSISAVKGIAIAMTNAAPVLEDVMFTANITYDSGTVYALDSQLSLTRAQFADNFALGYGAGIYLQNSTLDLQDARFEHNDGTGGIVSLRDSSVARLTRVSLLDNRGEIAPGIYVQNSRLDAANLIGSGHYGRDAGFIHCETSDVSLSNSTLVGNASIYGGGAFYGQDCNGSFINSIFAYNKAARGGALFAEVAPPPDATPAPEDTPADSPGATATPAPPSATPGPVRNQYVFSACDFFQNGPEPVLGTEPPGVDNLLLDPRFQGFTDDLVGGNDDLHLLPSSPLRDAGEPDPAFNDPDGSRGDIGSTGGPASDPLWSQDTDADLLPDGWERTWFDRLDLTTGSGDIDDDGLTNLTEYLQGLDPTLTDTDGDGLSDARELSEGTRANDTFSPNATLVLPTGRVTTLQGAIDAARDDTTILVPPGTYSEHIDFKGKAVTLKSTEGAAVTLITGVETFGIVAIQLGEDSRTVLDGFTLSNAEAEVEGAGLRVSRSSPTLQSLALINNYSSENGGGMAILDTTLSIKDLVMEGNSTYGLGGGLYVRDSQVYLEGVTLNSNSADTGGGIAADTSTLRLLQTALTDNSGSGLAASASTLQLDQVSLSGNSGTAGGAMFLDACVLTLTNSVLSRNLATDGAGLYLSGTVFDIHQVQWLSNAANNHGGAVTVGEGSSGTMSAVLFQDNRALTGTSLDLLAGGSLSTALTLTQATLVGGVASSSNPVILGTGPVSLEVTNSILAFNVGPSGAPLSFTDPALVYLAYTLVYGNRPDNNLPGTLQPEEGLEADPAFIQFTDDLKPDEDDLHLQPGSPARDAGDPTSPTDPDGSRADLGYFGGPDADFRYYADADFDGMADGWELQTGLDTGLNDASLDPDGDGLNNGQEAQTNTNPNASDTDHDGLSDSDEVQAGSSPTNAFDPGGQATVPQVFAHIQEALNAASDGATIVVNPGTYRENLNFLGKRVAVTSAGGPVQTIIDGGGAGPGISFQLGEGAGSVLRGFTVQNGSAANGGGIYVLDTSPRLENLIVTNNVALLGGSGLFLRGNPILNDVQVMGNRTSDGLEGGGILISGGAPQLTRLLVAGNIAQNGGGVQITSGTPLFFNSLFSGNQAALGGGVGLSGTDALATFVNSSFHANSAGGGAGIYNGYGKVVLQNCQVTGNTGPVGAGLMSREGGVFNLSYTNVWSNHGSNFSDEIPDMLGQDGNTSEDPRYFQFSDDGVWSNDDLHLRPDSLLAHAGDPSIQNPDGSRAEPGLYGGPNADRTFYHDGDQDTLYDGWESQHALDPFRDDSAEDPDADTVSNLLEFDHGTDPQHSDSDDDGLLDAEELATGSDPTDLFSPVSTVVVNDRFPSIQEALNQAHDGVVLQVREGSYKEHLDFRGKALQLMALGRPGFTILDGEGVGPVVSFRSGEPPETRLEGFLITGGQAQDGGGIRILQSSPTLHRVIVTGNTAVNSGGGLSISYGGPLLSNLLVYGNSARDGGGIGGRAATLTLLNATVVSNTATKGGGGLTCLDLCSPTLRNNLFVYNTAAQGGGVNIVVPGVLVFENNNVYGNTEENYGGIIDQTGRKGNLSVDPRFVKRDGIPETLDFHLTETSPCLDMGQDLSEAFPAEDLEGVPRPFDGNQDGTAEYDLGAYEYEFDVDQDNYLVSEGDCSEGDPSIHPLAPETCDDGIDQDCDGLDLSCLDVDNDQDGVTEHQGDCDDADAATYPNASEVADDKDNNCNGTIDEGFETPSPTPGADGGGCTCAQGPTHAGATPDRRPAGLPPFGPILLAVGALTLLRGRRRA